MYLKSLELFGFKSFAPKTVLEFHPGVTCVVGPNGCGKSNVLDAIRWVLGEQSAKALRGGEMADVIFSGTDTRAAVGMAEVSMTFTECEEALGLDWHEVTLTRRVFRDGGSEYFLNKTPCRLKDIHQLFMDTGIGRSAYSIMEQGKIDAILSSRPEDRRAIFEEAAGITKYKAQKKEALRKLEATEANLLRLTDIIKEVKRQIGSLQRQAGKARRYQALLGDLKMLETHAAKQQWELIEAQRAQVDEEHGRLADRQKDHEAEIERQEREVGEQRAALDEIETRLNAARQEVNDLKGRIANSESRIAFNVERANEFRGLIERYGREIAQAEERFQVQEQALHSTDTELEEITALLASELRLMEEKQAANAALGGRRAEIEKAIEEAARNRARIENQLSSLRGQTSSAQQQREAAEARLAFLAEESGQIELACSQLIERRTAIDAELARGADELAAKSAEASDAETELRESQMAVAAAEREWREAQRLLAEKESRRDALKDFLASGAAFSEGTQALLRGLDNPDFFQPGIVGALAQLLDVAPEFVSAVEAALGANLQAVVMKDSSMAESAIRTLHGQKLGRATVALREFIGPVPDASPEKAGEQTGGMDASAGAHDDSAVRPLRDVVSSPPELAPLVAALLRETFLVRDLETALGLRRERAATYVTLAGELVTPEGLLAGGIQREAAQSMLERKNQLHAIELELAAAGAALSELSGRRDGSLADVDAAQARLQEAREERQNAAMQLSTVRGQLGLIERETGELERKQRTLEAERTNSEARRSEADQRLAKFEKEMAAAAQHLEKLQQTYEELRNEIGTLRAQEAEVGAELNELKIKVATERQRHSSLHHQRAPMEARLGELMELVAQRKGEVSSYEERIISSTEENARISSELDHLRSSMGDAELTVAQRLDERANLAATVEELGNTLRILRHQLSECHDQRSRLEVRQAQMEMRSTAIQEHIQKRYHLDLREFARDLHGLRVVVRDQLKRAQRSGLVEQGEAEGSGELSGRETGSVPAGGEREDETGEAFALDWAVVERLVRELDNRLEGMGPVNLDAIQEFDELEERHQFLEGQNHDLTRSKEELLNAISKINQTTKILFAESFEKIRTNFAEMFVELFGGGKANLLLSDEGDPLESGIEIIAKPPGKQLSAISLLSGGERTMTAVALLFAIYMVKPSPFCVLDEMDAPLDESNINRFIRILDRFVDQSQFVVISHNKRTIARADAIYGVTMEEQGISKLVGVKFNKRGDAPSGADVLSSSATTHATLSVAETFGKTPQLASEVAMAAAS